MPLEMLMAANVYAPTSMKPAWPSENRPVKPFSRFMDTATRE